MLNFFLLVLEAFLSTALRLEERLHIEVRDSIARCGGLLPRGVPKSIWIAVPD